MSHYTVLVVGDDLEDQLGPYDESIEVDEYEEPCYCIGTIAKSESRAVANKKVGDFKELREKYHEMDPDDQPDWEDYIKPYLEVALEAEKAHPLCDKPDPECEECKGSGTRMSTYNPNSKWDWYVIGGRWTGFFKLKKRAAKDDNNSFLILPSGHVEEAYTATDATIGDPGLMTERAAEGYADQVRKKDVDWKGMAHESSMSAAKTWDKVHSEIREGSLNKSIVSFLYDDNLLKMSRDEYIRHNARIPVTYAVLKDGEWTSRGEMGWFGMSRDDMSDEEWDEEFYKMLEELPDDTMLTLVDCHI